MLPMDAGRLRQLLDELERAADAHERWHEAAGKAVVCRLPPDPRDLAEGSHRECEFGRWYHEEPPRELRDHPAFAAMALEHERVHRVAARVLRAAAAGAPVAPGDFDEYVEARQRLGLELDSLRRELSGLLERRDVLTGAHRRSDLLAELRELRELSRRGIQSCCIAFMDLDHFKAINDTHGHRAGDEVLAAAVAFVMTHLRPFDKVFRYGGDEFLICMPGADLVAGRAVIERIREGLSVLSITTAGGLAIGMTASLGIASLDPGCSVKESIDRADRALLAAKTAGRNRACRWQPDVAPADGELPFGRPDAAAG